MSPVLASSSSRSVIDDWVRSQDERESVLGLASPQMMQIQGELKQAARSDAKILLTGESGVGKEVIARLAHEYSPRRLRPFVAINCAGVPDTLLESELFGHVRGSFTGAYRDKPGLLEQANGGTIFLDEVGEMSLRMQALLLRFLEDGTIHRVGAERQTAAINVRVVTATNRVLVDRIAAGSFREDLYYRINVIHIVVPPLRERREDIEPLLRHFLHAFSVKYHVAVPDVSPDVQEKLAAYGWPGNVRELKNMAERLIVRCRGSHVDLADLPPAIAGPCVYVATGPAAESTEESAHRTQRNPNELYERIVGNRESFWSAVYEPFMTRDLTRDDLRAIVTAGLQHTRGNYKDLLDLFNMAPTDYKRFLNFLRKHECHIPFHKLRVTRVSHSVLHADVR
jgi:transcriptional regulator with PAS, ATPase and Fis domain